MKKLRHLSALILLVLIIFNVSSYKLQGLTLASTDKKVVVKVIEVIDGEAIKAVTLPTDKSTPIVKTIRMIGIKTNANKSAFNMSKGALLGKHITVVYDANSSSFPKMESNWEYGYIYLNNTSTFQEELLRSGLAEVDYQFAAAKGIGDMEKAYQYAMDNHLGNFQNTTDDNTPKVNLNTASIDQLNAYLFDNNALYLAREIIDYRKLNRFNHIEEIKFVNPYFSTTWYTANKEKLSVKTQLLTSTETELASLFSSLKDPHITANQWIEYRTFNNVLTTYQLAQIPTVSTIDYNKLIDYFTIVPTAKTIPYVQTSVNINTASLIEIQRVLGVDTQTGERLINYRDKYGYLFTSIQELTKDSQLLKDYLPSRLYQRIKPFTDINNANKDELISLFGKTTFSDKVKQDLAEKIIKNRPYTHKEQLNKPIGNLYSLIANYVYTSSSDRVETLNINFTDKLVVKSKLKLSNTDYNNYRDYPGYFRTLPSISFDLSKYTAVPASLYLNMNTLSYNELMSINGMSSDLAKAIMDYRHEQLLAYAVDLKSLFDYYKLSNLYGKLETYMVFY